MNYPCHTNVIYEELTPGSVMLIMFILLMVFMIIPSLICFAILTLIDIFNKKFGFEETKSEFQYLLESPSNFKFEPTFISKIKQVEESNPNPNPLIKTIDKFCQDNSIYQNGAIVSLSGGVDSMVTLAILLHLQTIHNFPIYTASIDYGLRKESHDESKFLEKYTGMFNIRSYISYVNGISRKKEDSGSRSEFEEESRNLRFNTYKKIIEENSLINPQSNGVFVAHHQDDIVENIFTNSMRGGNLLDLEVMKPISMINNVKIFRPLLGYKKQIIYDFAHEFGIPYFLDTTPKWSKRGQMRNEIFPLLDNVFGVDWRNKLKSLGSQSNEWGNYINTYIIEPWFNQVKLGSLGVIIPIQIQPKLIYQNIIMKSLHSIGENMIKNTSMDKIMNLIDNHADTNNQNNILTLDNSRVCLLVKTENNYQLVIFNEQKIKLVQSGETVDVSDIYVNLINGNVNLLLTSLETSNRTLFKKLIKLI